ncbi:hypothetical protein Tco_1205350 [Tanacetum coccineum]
MSLGKILPPWHQFLDQKIRGAHFSMGIVAGERFAIELTPSTFPQRHFAGDRFLQRHVAGEKVGMLLGKASNVVKKIEQSQEEQELEIIKAVAQAWLGHTTTTSPPSSTNEFDARRLNFKNKPTRFKVEAMTRPLQSNHHNNGLLTSWDFTQSLWDSYEIVADQVEARDGLHLLLEDELNASSKGKRKKESRNSLRNVFNRTSRRFD